MALLGACAGARVKTLSTLAVAPIQIDTLALRADTYVLAHDRLGGRDAGSPGGAIAARYVATRCLALGLEPIGAEYLLPVPLIAVEVAAAPAAVVVATPHSVRRYRGPEEVLPDLVTGRPFEAFEGSLVYAGPTDGLSSRLDSLGPLAGTVAVVAGIPEESEAVGLALRKRGVVGLVELLDDPGFEAFAGAVGRGHLALGADVPSSLKSPLPTMVGGPRLARDLLSELPRGRLNSWHRFEEWKLEARPVLVSRPVTAHNVACRLAGRDRAASSAYVAFSAHYDHLGIQTSDRDRDSIYNGFSDNAAGVAMVLAIARALTQERLSHSALFLFFTAEEVGLMGSDYFVARSPVPLEHVQALINLDGGAPPAPPETWRLAGGDASPLGGMGGRVAEGRHWGLTLGPARANSDHFPFLRAGVPAVLVVPGAGPYAGLTVEASEMLRRRWDRYHRPDDEWAADFSFKGLERYAQFALALGREVDRTRTSPGALPAR